MKGTIDRILYVNSKFASLFKTQRQNDRKNIFQSFIYSMVDKSAKNIPDAINFRDER